MNKKVKRLEKEGYTSVWADKEFECFYNEEVPFTNHAVGAEKPFDTNAHFYVFLASLAFYENLKTIKTKERGDAGQVRMTTFKNNGLQGVIYSLALNKKKDYSILKDDGACCEIFEGYVNAGYQLLRDNSINFASPEDLFEHYGSWIYKVSNENKASEVELKDDDLGEPEL